MKTLKEKLKASAAVFAASVVLCGCGTAWNPFGRVGEDPIRVTTYNIRLATVAAARPGKKLYPSDHFPVVATIELK